MSLRDSAKSIKHKHHLYPDPFTNTQPPSFNRYYHYRITQ